MGQSKKKEKYTIEEYQKIRAHREKRKFRLEFYPWPVNLALGIPFLFFLIMALTYFLYVKGLSNE